MVARPLNNKSTCKTHWRVVHVIPDGHMSCRTGWRGEGGSAQAHVMLHDVPEHSTAFFFFRALPPAVAPAAEVTSAAAEAVVE